MRKDGEKFVLENVEVGDGVFALKLSFEQCDALDDLFVALEHIRKQDEAGYAAKDEGEWPDIPAIFDYTMLMRDVSVPFEPIRHWRSTDETAQTRTLYYARQDFISLESLIHDVLRTVTFTPFFERLPKAAFDLFDSERLEEIRLMISGDPDPFTFVYLKKIEERDDDDGSC